ncbi:ATP-binding protein [Streptomyces megasporus]|uniref:ATP-binding protein n=1 Tax=Streptomyces megasporus TaxID=44060 RepID=UPI00068A1A73|nr:ATP-binding protein [Streptomyces megasporus]
MADLTDGRGGTGIRCEQLGAVNLYPLPESVPRARRWFRKFTTRYNPACSLDDCQVMLSELLTNAVLCGRAEEEWRVRVEWWRVGGSLRVDVHNPGFPANARMREAGAEEAHGRGLFLVDALADSWHVEASPHGGTVVSFIMHKAWPA